MTSCGCAIQNGDSSLASSYSMGKALGHTNLCVRYDASNTAWYIALPVLLAVLDMWRLLVGPWLRKRHVRKREHE